jgi:hypothetical protein
MSRPNASVQPAKNTGLTFGCELPKAYPSWIRLQSGFDDGVECYWWIRVESRAEEDLLRGVQDKMVDAINMLRGEK